MAIFGAIFEVLLLIVETSSKEYQNRREKLARDAEDEPGCQTCRKKVSIAKTAFSGKFAARCGYELTQKKDVMKFTFPRRFFSNYFLVRHLEGGREKPLGEALKKSVHYKTF